jgi:arginyl-tRNA synthetase
MTTKLKLEQIIKKVSATFFKDVEVDFTVNYPNEEKFGDYATNIALVLAKKLMKNPIDIAEDFKKELLMQSDIKDLVAKIDVVKPGFINFFLSTEYLSQQLSEITKNDKYGCSKIGKGKKVQIEFISANPTGPLTLANGRGGFLGDALANIMIMAGYKVQREYLVNDAGNQIMTLGKSILSVGGYMKEDETFYKGEYIADWVKVNKGVLEEYKKSPYDLGKVVAKDLFAAQIKPVIVDGMKIEFDKYFSEEKELHKKNKTEHIIKFLEKKNLTYKQDGALWFRTTDYGDDKDRVLITSDGRHTYMAIDIAYHFNKFKRGFDNVINIWGADHGGYVDRMIAGVNAIGYEGQLEIIIMQLVKLMSGGKEVRMSKRKGEYVTMQYLLDLLPLDVVRWFFLMYNPNTHMLFDLDLAKDKSEKNPVYYVQYAHARICSILNQAKSLKIDKTKTLNDDELSYIKVLLRWPEIVQDASSLHQLNGITTYAQLVAESFHNFYHKYRVINNDSVDETRINIMIAYKKVLVSILDSLGISAPDKM